MSSARVLTTLSSILMAQWHPTKNGNIKLEQVSAGSHKKAWWLCEEGHEWEAQIKSRTNGNGCSACSGKITLEGINDLATTHPEIASQWHPVKNQTLSVSAYTQGSHKRVWWLCDKGHEWESVIYNRVNGHGCPYCANKKILQGFNDLKTLCPDIAAEWHSTKNGELKPEEVGTGINRKRIWWQCSRKPTHVWQTSIGHRTRGSGCPFCSNRKIDHDFNDLVATHPDIAAEWHPTKNGQVLPQHVMAGHSKKVWWQCKLGHEWESSPIQRTNSKAGCHVCTGRTVLAGFNDLKTKAPHLVKEWHPTKNKGKLVTDFTHGSKFRAWWQCEKGHEWDTFIHERTRTKPTGCPKCSNPVSKAEKEIQKHIVSLGLVIDPSNRDVLKGNYELDIYIPEKNFAIEFNGLYWHTERAGKDKAYHYNKWSDCKEKGIQLVQIWEDDWTRNPEQIKRMLAHKLGISQERRVMARKTKVVKVSRLEAKSFLNENHIQGYANGSYYLGLITKDTDELVAVIVLKKELGTEGKTLNIIRYATSLNVVGGFTKLLSHAKKIYRPERFITFSDNCVSDGVLYRNTGFVADKELPPDYAYLANGARKHKFGYRLKRFRNDPELQYVEGYTERQLAELNGLERIWDAGKTRWVLETNNPLTTIDLVG